MAVNLNELLALPYAERQRLAEALMESTVPRDIGPLLRELVQGLERTNQVLAAGLERLSSFEARLEHARAEARDAASRSGDRWPFWLPE